VTGLLFILCLISWCCSSCFLTMSLCELSVKCAQIYIVHFYRELQTHVAVHLYTCWCWYFHDNRSHSLKKISLANVIVNNSSIYVYCFWSMWNYFCFASSTQLFIEIENVKLCMCTLVITWPFMQRKTWQYIYAHTCVVLLLTSDVTIKRVGVHYFVSSSFSVDQIHTLTWLMFNQFFSFYFHVALRMIFWG
jgi:hypothetical protein